MKNRKKFFFISCIVKKVVFTHGIDDYEGDVNVNSYYPTIGSMYTVYLGLQDKSTIDKNGNVQGPAIKMSVSKVVVVCTK